MDIHESTRAYESWLGKKIPLIKPDLVRKHESMAQGAFPFLRATFYRWFQLFRSACKDELKTETVLSVGDLHLENFGTWRDAEGRLVWGVNDFDEAYPLPFTHDLVRLTTSAHLAILVDHLSLGRKEASAAILAGYVEGLEEGPKPYVLAERHAFLLAVARSKLREPERFWIRLEESRGSRMPIPETAREALLSALPPSHGETKLLRRIAGLGSLGRHRWVAITHWSGGRIAREAKAVAPSACTWVLGKDKPSFSRAIATTTARAQDPFLRFDGAWIVRRLAPDCARVELSDLPGAREEARLLHSMGHEVANLHGTDLATRRKLLVEIRRMPSSWLHSAAKRMGELVQKDFSDWRDRAE
jgi:hypothetical protein